MKTLFKEPRRILVCGSRTWTHKVAILREMHNLPKDTLIIQGGAAGADTLAYEVAVELGLKHMTFKADWDKYGKAAGPRRNKEMLRVGQPDEVWAFSYVPITKGTANMVKQAKKAGVPVIHFEKIPGAWIRTKL